MSAPSVLDRIAERVRTRIAGELRRIPLDEICRQARSARAPHDFRAALCEPGFRIIAEVKLASPSEGDIAPHADPVQTAGAYLANGAAAISVLTEPEFFKGRPEYLRSIRAAYPQARLLMKDFVIDEYQIYRARLDGADAVLLILAMLSDDEARRFLKLACELGLTSLVEVHDEEELRRAGALGAGLIGVNNRNLKTLTVSLETSIRLAKLAPTGVTLVAESGLASGLDLRSLSAIGYRGFLIGTNFMKTSDPGAALDQLLREAQ